MQSCIANENLLLTPYPPPKGERRNRSGIYDASGLPDLNCSLAHAITHATLAENTIFAIFAILLIVSIHLPLFGLPEQTASG